jgi:hypothetical protein
VILYRYNEGVAMVDPIKKNEPVYKQVMVEENFMGARVRHEVIDYSEIVPNKGSKERVDGVGAVGISMRYIDPNKDGRLSFQELHDTYGKNARAIFDFMRFDMVKKYPPYAVMTTEKGDGRIWNSAWLKLSVDLIAWKYGFEIPGDSFLVDDETEGNACIPPAKEAVDCSTLPFQISQISAKCFLQSLEYLDHQIELFKVECEPEVS